MTHKNRFPHNFLHFFLQCLFMKTLRWYAQLLVLGKCYSYSRLAIGFKRCFGFLKPEAFFPLNITTGSLIARSFFYLYEQLFFLNILGHINSKL
jgi:hypothetical protein